MAYRSFGRSWQARHPPRYAAFSNLPSPNFGHSSVALGFQELVDLRIGEGGIAPEGAALHLVPVARHHGLQHLAPAIRRVHVPGPQRTAFQVAELIEHEQRVVAGAAEMAVVG